MAALTTLSGQADLPRHFASIYERLRHARAGRLDVVLPDGRRFRAEGDAPGPVAEVRVHEPDLFARMVREGDMGFSDAYLDGWWSTPDLQAVLDLAYAAGDAVNDGFPALALVRAYERLRARLRPNTRRRAPRNAQHHYDLGNAFYALWLDETMTYSSALFETGQESLEAAQAAKYAALLDTLELRAGDHLLEIGCGWGGLAELAARRGLRVTGLTLSPEQAAFARRRLAGAGLSDRTSIELTDYRDAAGTYDGIASIEMFEAVGERYWPTYFDVLRRRLAPGRRAGLQTITVADERFAAYRTTPDFIQKHVFPGGMLPSPSALRREVDRAGLRIAARREFGASYDTTLRRWHETFGARWPEIAALGFDARFRRLWEFYLTSCAAAFRFGACDVTQVTLVRPG